MLILYVALQAIIIVAIAFVITLLFHIESEVTALAAYVDAVSADVSYDINKIKKELKKPPDNQW